MARLAYIAAAIALLCASSLCPADDAPLPDTSPLIAAPPTNSPSPVVPSVPPTGYTVEKRPVAAPIEGNQVEVEGSVRMESDEAGKPSRAVVSGPVTVRFKNIVITGDDGANLNFKTNQATFAGNVVLQVDGQQATMRSLTLNLKTREWSGERASTTIGPKFAKGYLRAPLFAEGAKVGGIGSREIDIFGGDSTTCDLPDPHYHFTAKSVAVYPDDKIVMRNAALYALGKRLVTIPRFVVPIKQIQRNPNLIPRVGQSTEEGFFIKAAYSYLGTRTHTGFLLLDAMSEKGIGTGLRHTWRSGLAQGQANLYYLRDNNINQNTLTGRLSHAQQFGTVRATLSSDFRSNSYLYASESKTLVNRIGLTRNRPGADSSLAITQNINSYVTRTENTAATLRHKQLLGTGSELETVFDYTSFTSSQQTRARLTSNVLFERDEHNFDWHISAKKFTDLSDEAFAGQSGFGGIESTPEVGIVTDTSRLHRTLFGLPATLKFNYGEYNEITSNTEEARTYLALDTPVRRFDLGGNWSLGAGGGFKQYAYSDDTAQYSLDASALLSRKLGPRSALNFTYRYQRPKGYTPFRFDYVSKYNVVNTSLDLKDSSRFQMSLLTGYNFEQKAYPWQDIVLRFSVKPSPSVLLYTATGYDINNSRWNTVINQFRVRAGERFKLDIGTRYDTTRSKLATAKVNLDTALGKRTRLEALAGYNGFTKEFDYRGLAITRDLHCWEASITYIDQVGFYKNKGITLNLRIKAFPMNRDFGLGAFGQTQDTSVGQWY